MKTEAAPETGATPEMASGPVITGSVTPISADDPVKYDEESLNSFLSAVFHTPREITGEYIFVQGSKNAPRGFGTTPDKLFKALGRTEAPMPCYFGTSTLTPENGEIRHKKDCFAAMHVLVLDDIGTKIPEDTLPDGLVENYCIESSEGNYQLGFILKEPIRSYREAQELMRLFADAGLTDGGGCMPVKKVRLPCGVNGKPGPKQNFPVTLKILNTDYWEIQELLDAAEIDVDWAKHLKTSQGQLKRTARLGVTAWCPGIRHYNPDNGVYDPVLEFLYDRGWVLQDTDSDFFDIICPFHDEHSGTDIKSKTCGYSPLGHGMFPHRRIKHCFHDSCSSISISDFLLRLHMMGAPLMPAEELNPEAMTRFVYDSVNDRVYDIKEKGEMVPRRVESINRITPKVFLPSDNGKPRAVEQLPLWLKQPSALIVKGATHDPSNRERLVTGDDGSLRANLFYLPEYPAVVLDSTHVNVFTQYIEYLIPSKDERDYFMRWLACKVQHPEFRGAAMVLISLAQGTGKNTLMKIISALFGKRNTMEMSMERLLAPGEFNDWAAKLFVNVNESLATEGVNTARRAYNRLKAIIDPMAMEVLVNQKYSVPYHAICATSFMFFSNHVDAVYLQQGDRRFFAASGPEVPASPDYFTRIHKWLNSAEWMPHIWQYLSEYPVDMAEMMAKPPVSDTMRDILHETASPLEAVIDTAIEIWPSALVPPSVIKGILPYFVTRGVPDKHLDPARRLLSDRLRSLRKLRGEFDDRIDKRVHGLRDSGIYADIPRLEREKEIARAALTAYDEQAFIERINHALVKKGFFF